MSEQPMPIQVADAIENLHLLIQVTNELAAKELRRLHEVNQELYEALEIIKSRVCGDPNPNWHDADARFASRAFIADVADAALAKLEESHD